MVSSNVPLTDWMRARLHRRAARLPALRELPDRRRQANRQKKGRIGPAIRTYPLPEIMDSRLRRLKSSYSCVAWRMPSRRAGTRALPDICPALALAMHRGHQLGRITFAGHGQLAEGRICLLQIGLG